MEDCTLRFNKNHKLLIELINELNFEKDIIKIYSSSTFIDTKHDLDYFVLKNGLSSIINNLLSFIKNKEKHLFLNSEVNFIKYNKENNYFNISINN